MIPMIFDSANYMPRFAGESMRTTDPSRHSDSSGAMADWIPPTDVAEFKDRFELFVDLPGVDPKDVDITLEDGVLTLAGERRVDSGNDDENGPLRRRVERGHGQFFRRFVLPDTVDADSVNARDVMGVLQITIPKHARALPRRIEVAA